MTLRSKCMALCVALCAVLTAGGAQAQAVFAFSSFNDATNTCEGRLLGMVADPDVACAPDPYGLGAGSYVAPGSEDCQRCGGLSCDVFRMFSRTAWWIPIEHYARYVAFFYCHPDPF